MKLPVVRDHGLSISLIISTFSLFCLFLIAWSKGFTKDIIWRDLYGNVDGQFFAWHAKALVQWSNPFDLFAFNPFQGMVSVFLPYSPWWNPAALALSLPFTEVQNIIISYSIYWVELFFSVFLLARTVGLTKTESFIASQALVMCTFPPFLKILFPPTVPLLTLGPFFVHLMAMFNVMVVLFIQLGTRKWIYNIILISSIFGLLFVSFMTSAFYFMVFSAVYGSMSVGLLFYRFNRASFLWKVSAIALICIVALALKIPDYYFNASEYSTRSASSDTFISFSLQNLLNSFNHWKLHKYDFCLTSVLSIMGIFCPLSRWFSIIFFMAFIGGIIGLFWRSGKYRWIAGNFCFLSVLPDVLGFCFQSHIISGKITSIAVFYYAWASQAFAIIFFILFLSFISRHFLSSLNSLWVYLLKMGSFKNLKLKHGLYQYSFLNINIAAFLVVMVLPIGGTYYYSRYILGGPLYCPDFEKNTASVEYLRNHAAIVPGASFRGFTASYFASPGSPLRKTYCQDFDSASFNSSHYVNMRLVMRRKYGNMHILTDLWKYNIPTLEEHGQSVNMPVSTFFKNLLSKNKLFTLDDLVSLNVFTLDLRVLGALGTRFIITDQPLKEGGVSLILEQKSAPKDNQIDFEVANKAKEIFHNLTLEKNSMDLKIQSSLFKEEFQRSLDQSFVSKELRRDKDQVLLGLESSERVAFGNIKNREFSRADQDKIYKFFFGFLANNAIPPSLYLYEINNANLGSFSPTQTIYSELAEDMFDIMKNPEFSFEKSVIIQDRDIPKNLVTAKNTKLYFKRNKVQVKAESEGWSLLLLPIQYSHCLRISKAPDEDIRLIRANLIQSALLFKGKIDTHIHFKYNTDCRKKDILFCKTSNIKFGPVAPVKGS